MNKYRELRLAKRLTLSETAKAVGVSIFSLIRWEKGETFPTADKLEKLAELLGATPNELLGVDEKTLQEDEKNVK